MNNAQGETRSVTAILDDLAGKWNTLTKEQQKFTAEQFAGYGKGDQFIALMQEYGTSLRATETAMNSQGAAALENDKYMGSLQGRIDRLKASWDGLASAAGNAVLSDTVIVLTGSITSLLTALTKVVDTIGLLPLLLGAGGFAFVSFNGTIRNAIVQATAMNGVLAGLRGGIAALGVSIKGMLASTGIGLLLVGIGIIAEGLINAFAKANEQQQQFFDNLEQNTNQRVLNLNELVNLDIEYNSGNKSEEEKLQIRQRMAELMPEIIAYFDEEGAAVYKTKEEVQKILDKEKERLAVQKEILANSVTESPELKSAAENISEANQELNQRKPDLSTKKNAVDIINYLEDYKNDNQVSLEQIIDDRGMIRNKEVEEHIRGLSKNNGLELTGQISLHLNSDNFYTEAARVRNEYAEVSNTFEGLNTKIIEGQKVFVDKFSIINETITDKIGNQNANLILGSLSEEYISSIDISESNVQEVVRNYQGLTRSIADYINKNKIDLNQIIETGNFDKLEQALQASGVSANMASKVMDSFITSVKSAGNTTNLFDSEINDSFKKYTELKTETDLLNQAQEELQDSNHLSAETIQKLNKVFPEFIKTTKLTKEGILEYIRVYKNSKKSIYEEELSDTRTTIEQAKLRLEALEAEIRAREKIPARIRELSAQLEQGNLSEETADKLAARYYKNAGSSETINRSNHDYIGETESELKKALQEEKENLDTLLAKANLSETIVNSLFSTSEKATKQQDNQRKATEKANAALEKQRDLLQNIKNELAILQNERNRLKPGSSEYRKSLEQENNLITKQIDLLKKSKDTTATNDTTPTPSAASGQGTTSSSQATGKYANLINKHAAANGIDPKLIQAIIQAESSFNPNATSSAGAQGLMQLMPGTAKQLGVRNAYDPEQNIKAGTKYFAEMLEMFNGNVRTALYAYNAGPNRVKQWDRDGRLGNIPYSETKKYANNVLKYYGANTTTSTASSSSKATDTSSNDTTKDSKQPDTKEKIFTDKDVQISSLIQELENNRAGIIQDLVREYQDKLQTKDDEAAKSQGRQSRYSQVSEEWRKEESSQINLLEEKQQQVEQMNKELRRLVQEKQITNGEFDRQIAENSTQWWELEKQKQDKYYAVIVSNLDEYQKKIDEAGYELELSRSRMSMLDENSSEYQQELQKQIGLLNQQREATLKQIEAVNRQLANEKLSIAQKEELSQRLNDLTKQTLDYSSAIYAIKESAADKIISNYKKLIEQQRDFALQAIEDQTKAENKRHEQRLKNIDEEHKAFENYIRNELEQLDRNAQSEDYESELKSKIDERQKLQDRFNKLLLDTSYEAKMKRQDLQAQMDTKDEEIAKFKEDRERELRKQGLNDQLQDRQDIVEQIKDTENDLNKSILDNIDSEKTQTERKYKDMLEDEQRFYQIKQNLMSEDSAVVKAQIEALKGEYGSFFSFLKERAFETSQQFQNMMNSFQLDESQLDNFQNLGSQIGTGSGNGSGSGTGNTAGSSKTDEAVKAAAWQDYLENKRKAEDIRKKMAKLDKSSAAYKDLDKQFQALYNANEAHRKKHGFPDKSYDELKKLNLFSAEQGGVTGSGSSWQQGKFALLHEKEMVLNKADTGNILNAVGVARSIMDKLQALTPASIFKTVNQQSSSTSTDQSIAIDQVIIQASDKDSGSKLWRSFEAALNTKMKSRLV